MAHKVLLVIGDAVEATDTLYPYFRVQEDGYECVVSESGELIGRDRLVAEQIGHACFLATDWRFRQPVTKVDPELAERDTWSRPRRH